MVGHAIVWLMVFSSFFVLFEPAPYELIGVVVIGAAFLLGLAIPRAVLPLLGLLTLYVLGGFIGVLIAPDLSAARFQISVTAFLAITSVFFACYVAVDPVRRMRPLIVAWQLGAIMAAVLGVIGYLNIAGTFELFTLSDARAAVSKTRMSSAPSLPARSCSRSMRSYRSRFNAGRCHLL